jgi:transposase-like protein
MKTHNQSGKNLTKRYLFSVSDRYASEKGRKSNMPYCPECGGEMHYTSSTKRYVCKSCGLSVTHQELMELREQNRPKSETDEEQRQRERREYLKWWLSNKKK